MSYQMSWMYYLCSFYFEGQFTTVCNMNFEKFPLDTQKCTVLFGSISQQVDVVVFEGQLNFNEKTQRTLQYSVSKKETIEFKMSNLVL